MKFIDLTGKKFGRLFVVKRGENKDKNHTAWICKCDCGNTALVLGKYLKNGKTLSCGCMKNEQTKQRMIDFNKKQGKEIHGETNSRLYNIWCGMKQRCYNPNDKNYGGRGIKVCDEWKNSFNNFKKWALNNGYEENLTIERINVNSNYCPKNCTWIPLSEQSKNTRRNKKYLYNGEIKTITDFARKYNINRATLSYRLFKLNWSIEKAIETKLLK